MSELRDEVLRRARQYLDAPFRHHYKPDNVCNYGRRTIDSCMEYGMDSAGFDCSGLAIASLCDVLAISPREWPRELRHTAQLRSLETEEEHEPGDWKLFYNTKNQTHLGVATETDEVVHASGITKIVEEGIVEDASGSFRAIRVVTINSLIAALNRAKDLG
jgi:hypothetical protein